jgi:hypothetical protein
VGQTARFTEDADTVAEPALDTEAESAPDAA